MTAHFGFWAQKLKAMNVREGFERAWESKY